MKALTICQPYAELIACGEKRVENRTWSTSYRGPLAIHAGTSRAWLHTYRPLPKQMDFGKVIAIADLVDVIHLKALRLDFAAEHPHPAIKRYVAARKWILSHDHASGPFCWVLENVRRIDPVIAVGRQGLWNWRKPE